MTMELPFPALTIDTICQRVNRYQPSIGLLTSSGRGRVFRLVSTLRAGITTELRRGNTVILIRSVNSRLVFLAYNPNVDISFLINEQAPLGIRIFGRTTYMPQVPGDITRRYVATVIARLAQTEFVSVDYIGTYITITTQAQAAPFEWRSSSSLRNALVQAENRVNQRKAEVERTTRALAQDQKIVEENKRKLAAQEETRGTFQDQIEAIKQMALVDRVESSRNTLTIHVPPIMCMRVGTGRDASTNIHLPLPPASISLRRDTAYPEVRFIDPSTHRYIDASVHPHTNCMGDYSQALALAFENGDLVSLVASFILWFQTHGAGSYAVYPRNAASYLFQVWNGKHAALHYPNGRILQGVMRIGYGLAPLRFLQDMAYPIVSPLVGGYAVNTENSMESILLRTTRAAAVLGALLGGFYPSNEVGVQEVGPYVENYRVHWEVTDRNPHASLLHRVLHLTRVAHQHDHTYGARHTSFYDTYYNRNAHLPLKEFYWPLSSVGRHPSSRQFREAVLTHKLDIPNTLSVASYVDEVVHNERRHAAAHGDLLPHQHGASLGNVARWHDEHSGAEWHRIINERREQDFAEWVGLPEAARLIGRIN